MIEKYFSPLVQPEGDESAVSLILFATINYNVQLNCVVIQFFKLGNPKIIFLPINHGKFCLKEIASFNFSISAKFRFRFTIFFSRVRKGSEFVFRI